MARQRAILGELVDSGVSQLAFQYESTLTETMRGFHAEGEMRAMRWMHRLPRPAR